MILVDTSIWIDHLHARDETLQALLDLENVVMHPFVLGELALGRFRHRQRVFELLDDVPLIDIADADEVRRFIDVHEVAGTGLGYVDVHLLASLHLAVETRLWTRDRRLHAVAERMGLAHVPSGGGVHEPSPARYEFS